MATVADEGRLARAAADGDGVAFATLYDAYEKRIFNFCLRLVGSQEDAADATQDAFVKVLQRLPKITGELNFGAYLFTAARNASYDIIGKRKRAEPVEEIGDVTGRPLHGDERGHIDIDPERAAMLAALQVSVQAANAKLPERQREVLALRELEDMSYDEIAAVMDMNRNSVAQLISRARIKLRDELEGSALASVSAATPDCQKALPLIAMRQDGQLKDAGDKQWLKSHISECATCKVSVEAMEEAGVSYRAWVPIVPLLWLRKATIAKAAERCGFDWSEVADSPRGGDGSSGEGGGSGSGSGGGSGSEGGVGAGAGAAAGTVGGLTVADDAEAGKRGHHVRRAILAVLGLALIAVLFMQLVPGDDEDSTTAADRAAQTTPIVTPLPTSTPLVHHKRPEVHHKAHKVVHHKVKHRKHKHHKHHKKTTVVVASGGTTTTVTPTTTVSQVVSSSGTVHHHTTTTTHHHTPTPPTHKTKTTTIHATGGGSGVKTTTTHATRPTPPPVTTTTTTQVTPPPPVTTTTTTTDVTPPPVTTTTTTTTRPPQLPPCPPGSVAPPPGRCTP